MKIAVSSANTQKISGPANQCNSFLIYEIKDRQVFSKIHLQLKPEEVLQNLKQPLSKLTNHPLTGVSCIISQSLGNGMSQKLADDGIQTMATNGMDPDGVVNAYLQIL